MPVKKWCWILLVVPVAMIARSAAADIRAEQVEAAIEGGMAFLKKEQKANGSWSGHPGYPGGMTSLCALALLNCGEPSESPAIQKALRYLRSLDAPEMVYSTALQTMVFCAAEPETDRLLISRNVQWLEGVQIKSGERRGAWKYSDRRGSGDNSNSQFALLALHEAERIGIRVEPATWQAAVGYWIRQQNADGSWGYFPGEAPTGSMTSAGIASVIIASGRTTAADARVENDRVLCCGSQENQDVVERGLSWLASKFSVTRNPNPINDKTWLYYYLYGVERVGRLSGRRFIGRTDWYREGAEYLLKQQNSLSGYWRGELLAEENALIATSFSLLFLGKGRRPVVVSQLQYSDDSAWNPHRSAIPHLTQRLERRWSHDLTWQTIDLRSSTPDELLGSPVLFMSGKQGLSLTGEQRDNLRHYVNRGGFLFVEAGCGGETFDRSFRQLMKSVFPDNSLRLLPADHPVWFAEQRVDPDRLRPLYGINTCCRTSVVYCPEDLSCYWELETPQRSSDYSPTVQAEIEACVRIGMNVITYATNRELKSKLDQPLLASNTVSEQPQRGVLYVPKLLHGGGGDDAPNALPNLLSFLASETGIRVGIENRLTQPGDPRLFDYPVLFMHGRRDFRFSSAQRTALRSFLERGGLVFADAICGSPEFARAFRREFAAILGGAGFQRIPPDHPLFSRQYGGFELSSVTVRDPQVRNAADPLRATLNRISPLFEGGFLDERLSVVFSLYDISCALENSTSLECKSYLREDAARLSVNVVLFALQQ
jgi:hypothetical protein